MLATSSNSSSRPGRRCLSSAFRSEDFHGHSKKEGIFFYGGKAEAGQRERQSHIHWLPRQELPLNRLLSSLCCVRVTCLASSDFKWTKPLASSSPVASGGGVPSTRTPPSCPPRASWPSWSSACSAPTPWRPRSIGPAQWPKRRRPSRSRSPPAPTRTSPRRRPSS